jgi:AcrR family transcriptional regulator
MNQPILDNNINPNKQAKVRLLDSAEILFAEKGYDGTSIRDLTKAAKCNIAAVNYHFSGKENLYYETVKRIMVVLRDVRIERVNELMSSTGNSPGLERLLRTFSDSFLEPLVHQSRGKLFIKLMTREMLNPRLPMQMFYEQTIAPVMKTLQQALCTVCPNLTVDQCYLCIISLIGQLIQVLRIIECSEMFGYEDRKPETSTLIDHVVSFSTIAIRGMENGNSEHTEPADN